ncbi:MAG: tRNA pseudouridine(54/55) synthase Pus10 [Thermoprotei archaeon]
MERKVGLTQGELEEFAQKLCDECRNTLSNICGVSLPMFPSGVVMRCVVCSNVRKNYAQIFDQVFKELNKFGEDWRSFRIDVLVKSPPQLDERMVPLFQALKDSFKKELKREIGSKVEGAGKIFDPEHPDIFISFEEGRLTFSRPTVYLEGRYLKLFRNISQAKWVCNNCHGDGCIECNYRGRHFIASVEEFITLPIYSLYRPERVVFHAGGREDVDVLVVGSGRPFVIEVVNPLFRITDLRMVEQAINNYSRGIIQVTLAGFASSSRIEEVKSGAEVGVKKYRGIIKFFDRVNPNILLEVPEKLSGVTLEQRTPWRVKKRRADKVRSKKVYSFILEGIDEYTARFTVECQGGTYVKEFISGDDGRTTPSVAQILGIRCKCVALDLVGVDMKNG